MDVYEAIRARYSSRSYSDRRVDEEMLARILQAVRLAPSARNEQEWRFIVVRDPERKRKLMASAFGQPFVGEAPVVIAACAVSDGRIMTCGQPAYVVNTAIAVDHLTLAAVAEGLATCWVCRFSEPEAKQALGVPAGEEVRVLALIPLGYPKDRPPGKKNRLPLEKLIHKERWDPLRT